MIDEKEIKIGNWFHHNDEWSYRQDKKGLPMKEFDFQWDATDWYALGECILFLETVSPIELSEEWLLRFGFKNKKSSGTSYFDNYWLLDKYGISKCTFDNNGYRKGSFYCGNTEREIKHVHQLMNLYFALTGKELTIQPLKV